MQDVTRAPEHADAGRAPFSPSAVLQARLDPARYTRFLDRIPDPEPEPDPEPDPEPVPDAGTDPSVAPAPAPVPTPAPVAGADETATGEGAANGEAATGEGAADGAGAEGTPDDGAPAAAPPTPPTGVPIDDARAVTPGREVPAVPPAADLADDDTPPGGLDGLTRRPTPDPEPVPRHGPRQSRPARPAPARDLRALQPLLRAPASVARSATVDPAPELAARYLAHSCDLTLSGGTATALAAPLAVCALAEHYVLRRVAGASAAAASAALSAAAELGRTAPAPAARRPTGAEPATGDPAGGGDPGVPPGFAGLAAVISWLTGEDDPAGQQPRREQWRLARLFTPGAGTRDAHRLLIALVRPQGRRTTPRWLRLAAASLATFDLTARIVLALLWIGAVAGAAGMVAALLRASEISRTVVLLVVLPLAVTFLLAAAFGTVLLAARGLRRTVRTVLADDGWGVVAGVLDRPADDGTGEGAAAAPATRAVEGADAGADAGAGAGAGAAQGGRAGSRASTSEPRHRLDRLAGTLAAGEVPPLMAWLADRIDDLAGVPGTDGGADRDRYALTFGELWLGRLGTRSGNDVRLLRRAAGDPQLRVIDLVTTATDLTERRPYVLPFGAAERTEELLGTDLLFCRECLVEVMPARIADQMVLMAPAQSADGLCPRHAGVRLNELPDPWDLPVAFAVRMAISAPGVLRAVPLYTLAAPPRPALRDAYGAPVGDVTAGAASTNPGGAATTGGGPARVRTHWFCDGGVTGGLPSSSFDVTLPRWPTFSLAAQADPGAQTGQTGQAGSGTGSEQGEPDWVDVPEQDAMLQQPRWHPVNGAAGLLGAAIGTAGSWRDGLRAHVPGLRGRLALVHADAGLGIFTPQPELLRLALRGYHAGVTLRDRFTGPDGEIAGQTQTDRYRWVRMRVALREHRRLSLAIGARIPLYTDLALQYRVPAALSTWFSPPLAPGHTDPAWGDAVAAVTHLKSLADGGVLDWDTDWGAPPGDPDLRLTD